MLARTRLGLAPARAVLPGPVVLVPTMGALHDGHRALLRCARQAAGPSGSVVVSVFVNPLQFGPAEDLDRYPRTLDEDLAICAAEGVALVFAPGPAQMYPRPQLVTVDPGPAGQRLEGASRPGFFTGVLTVVLKLFELARPDEAVFGEKDAQQLALVRQLAADLCLPVRVRSVPIVRDPDGLAISSRNVYLSAPERATARGLPAALAAAQAQAGQDPATILAAARAVLTAAGKASPPLTVDYLELADPATFEPAGPGYQGPGLLLVAAAVGTTRLIDNTVVAIGPGA
jgi:pantoate--beta-alanine ligase